MQIEFYPTVKSPLQNNSAVYTSIVNYINENTGESSILGMVITNTIPIYNDTPAYQHDVRFYQVIDQLGAGDISNIINRYTTLVDMNSGALQLFEVIPNTEDKAYETLLSIINTMLSVDKLDTKDNFIISCFNYYSVDIETYANEYNSKEKIYQNSEHDDIDALDMLDDDADYDYADIGDDMYDELEYDDMDDHATGDDCM